MVTEGRSGLGLIEGSASVRGDGDESAVGAAGCATVGAGRAGGATEGRADRDRRLEVLAVAVLAALRQRERAGEALRAMSDDEGQSAA